jgi:hypothetical protein
MAEAEEAMPLLWGKEFWLEIDKLYPSKAGK